MILLVWPPPDHLWIGRKRGQVVLSDASSMTNVRARPLAEDPGSTRPELRIPNAAAQTRVVSVARILGGSPESERPFKGIFCDDISEFESDMTTTMPDPSF